MAASCRRRTRQSVEAFQSHRGSGVRDGWETAIGGTTDDAGDARGERRGAGGRPARHYQTLIAAYRDGNVFLTPYRTATQD